MSTLYRGALCLLEKVTFSNINFYFHFKKISFNITGLSCLQHEEFSLYTEKNLNKFNRVILYKLQRKAGIISERF